MRIKQVTHSLVLSSLLLLPLFGCATPAQPKVPVTATKTAIGTDKVADKAAEGKAGTIAGKQVNVGADLDWRSDVVMRAMSLLGVTYKFGGNTPETGLDCSGFVRLVMKDVLGYLLPRRSEEIGYASQEIHTQDLKPGDLVFFNTLRKSFSHVGIYIGNNQFIHAPSTGGSIKIDTLDKSYWTARFNGARRLIGLPELTADSSQMGK
jgi:cell wall-associated NlpC family hydrolase